MLSDRYAGAVGTPVGTGVPTNTTLKGHFIYKRPTIAIEFVHYNTAFFKIQTTENVYST